MKKLLIPLIIIVIAVGLLLISQRYSQFAMWYAAYIFPIFPHTMGRLFGLFPFSVFEIFFVLTPVALIFAVINIRRAGIYVLYAVSGLVLTFVLTAGINYNRESYADHIGITVQESPVEELVNLYLILLERAWLLHDQIDTDENGNFQLRRDGLYDYAIRSMHGLHERYGGLGTFFPRAKAPLLSRLILSNSNISGFFSPWTMEAHYNGDMPGQSIPFVINHELAHFIGHMREDEANFIGYLASRDSESVCFQYSAVYVGLSYTLNALRRAVSLDLYMELFYMLPEQVKRDFAFARDYWRQFEGPAADMQVRINDAYLRMNQQEDGVRSYGRMVDLLLAYYR